MNVRKQKTKGFISNVNRRILQIAQGVMIRLRCGFARFCRDTKGQGTTEYAILVGVLVVIACLAITVFKPKIQELWDAISSGINGL